MGWTGDHHPGLGGPPFNWHSGKIRAPRGNRTIHLHMDNDAFEVVAWNRYDDESEGSDPPVAFMLSRGEAFRLGWWIARWWLGEWGGLRRRVWYLALRRHLARQDRKRGTP